MRVSRKDEKLLRAQKGLITLETRKDGVRFTTAELKNLSRSYMQCCTEYESVQSEIVKKALEIVASYTPVVEDATEIFAELDCLVSFATVAVAAVWMCSRDQHNTIVQLNLRSSSFVFTHYRFCMLFACCLCVCARELCRSQPEPYTRPTVLPLGAGRIELLAARHPCLEAQDAVAFIANDVQMKAGESALQIVTGPNMGGACARATTSTTTHWHPLFHCAQPSLLIRPLFTSYPYA